MPLRKRGHFLWGTCKERGGSKARCLAGRSVSHFAVNDSVPPREAFGASLLPSSVKASTSWFFCRLSLIESCVLLVAPYCLGLHRLRDYYARCSLLLHDQGELLHPQSRFRDMPQISRGKFDRLPRTTAGFTTSAFDGCGLRDHLLARPAP